LLTLNGGKVFLAFKICITRQFLVDRGSVSVMKVKLTQLPVKILLSLVWIILASPVAHSQSANMSDITLPSPDSMISDPTDEVTETPTEEVTETPTDEVTETPTEEVTETPTEEVTETPTEEVTETPTDEVTETPTDEVTETPTDEVTETPTDELTETPTEEVTETPTEEVTETPTEELTETPTEEVTETPTEEVTETPTEEVTETPTEEVTETPTEEVTETPTEELTETPTDEVTETPTDELTETPTEEVTETPTEEVTETPTDELTETPTEEVTETPTEEVTETPTDELTETPTDEVTETPTEEVTETPTEEVTETPTEEVTETPTDEVTETPTDEVTETPTDEVTETPTEEVTETPTDEVTETPTDEVTETPTDEVTETPTDEVTETPTNENTDIDASNTAEDLETDTGEDIVQESVTNSIDAKSEIETLDVDLSNLESGTIENETPTVEEAAATEKLTESNDIVKKLFDQAEEREVSRDQEAKKDQTQKEKVAEEKNPASAGQVDRPAYEVQFQSASNDLAIAMNEEFQMNQLVGASGIELYGSVPSAKEISHRLAQLAQQTGKKPAFINISLQENQVESIVVLPEQGIQANGDNSLVASFKLNGVAPAPAAKALTVRKTIKNTSRKDILAKAAEFRAEVGDIRKLNQNGYKQSSQELYNVLIKPLEAELEANGIDVLVFSMDSGLRLLPVAALYDGKQFLIEKYAMGMVPSFGLTDTRYVSPENNSILAMGASEFRQQPALPSMPIELKTIVSNPRHGESFLNQKFTIPNFVAQNRRKTPFSIIHLGTHAKFKTGDLNDSYIQFYDGRLKIPQLQRLSEQLGWTTSDTPIELLVLSACETALGDKDAELGFAGLSVQAGVKSALASLWNVSDLGTLAMMGEFYDQLGDTLNKSEALRQTQLRMLRGNVKVDGKQVKLSNGTKVSLPADFPDGTLNLDHPYFWSAFTLIGNWN
jgi:CHAT domain-containing protein